MKKEKRKLTLNQLNKKAKMLRKTRFILGFIAIIGCIIIVIIAQCFVGLDAIFTTNNFFKVIYMIHALFWFTLAIITNEKCSAIIKETKVATIKEKAKEGNLKESLVIKNEKIIAEIISKDIEAVALDLDEITAEDLTIEFYFRSGSQTVPIKIQMQYIVNQLNETEREIIFNKEIDKIEIVEECLNPEIMTVKIEGRNIHYERTQVTADDLLDTFELKEE